MNKLQLIAVAFVTAIATLTVAPSALAVESGYTCENGFTGPDSKNLCISEVEYACEIENNTEITLTNQNDQTSTSGTATINDSTTAGGAASGTATNSNGANFNVSITNYGEEGEVCVANQVKPAIPPVTPEAPKTPETPKVTAPQAEKPAVLAKTSGDNAFVYALGAAASLAAAAGIARLAVAAYARLKN